MVTSCKNSLSAAYERNHIEGRGRLKTYGLDRNTHKGRGIIVREVEGAKSFRVG
jgi:hypothetical protein